MHPLAVHEVDQVLLGRAQQLGVAGHRLGVVEDRDIHGPGFVRQREPAAKIVAELVDRLRPRGIAHHHLAGAGRKAALPERVEHVGAELIEIRRRDGLGEDEPIVLVGAECLLAAPLAAHHDEAAALADRLAAR